MYELNIVYVGADATRKEINNYRPFREQREVDKVIAACISRLGEAAFADAYDDGQGMTLDEAVALAVNKSEITNGNDRP